MVHKNNIYGENMSNTIIKESKRERFVRLAEARTNKIIDMLDLLGNCSNRNIYEYKSSVDKRVFNTIEEHLRDSKRKFTTVNNEKNSKFSLK